MVLDPIIPEKGLAMLYAPRGIGKTHVALGIVYAAASAQQISEVDCAESAPRFADRR
jgi:hypothetical protein